MYFLVAGLSIKNLLEVEGGLIYQILFYLISATILIFGILNYLKQNKKINESRVHIGNFKTEYQKSNWSLFKSKLSNPKTFVFFREEGVFNREVREGTQSSLSLDCCLKNLSEF